MTYNEGFELSGMVERDENCTGPLEVEIARRVYGTDTYETLASTPVNGAGAWRLQVVGEHNASYIAQVKRTDTCEGDSSSPTDVLVKAKIAGLKVPRVCSGTIRGRIQPSYEGTKVVLERKMRGRWTRVDRDVLDTASRFSLNATRCGVHRVVWPDQGVQNEASSQRLRL